MTTTGTRSAIARPTSSTAGSVAPAASAAVPAAWITGPVGERVGERDAELDQVGARQSRRPGRSRARCRDPDTRPSDRASAPRGGRWPGPSKRLGDPLLTGRASSEVPGPAGPGPRPESLSPGPTGTRDRPRCPGARTQASAMALSSAGMIPSSLAIGGERGERRSRQRRRSGPGPGRAARRARVRCPGSRARRRSSGPRELTVLVLHDGREEPCRTRGGRPRERAPWRPDSSPRRRPRPRSARPRRIVEREDADRVEPPPTQANTRAAGARPARASGRRASSPMTRWRSRTRAGYGVGPTQEPMM